MSIIRFKHHDDTVVIGSLDNCIAAVWRGPPTVGQLKDLKRHGMELARSYPGGTLFLNIMLHGNPKFSNEARKEAAEQTAQNAMKAVAGAHIIAAKGLVAAAVRAFMSTVMMVGRPTRPTKVFASIQDAAPWLLEYAAKADGPRWTEQKLVAFYDELVSKA